MKKALFTPNSNDNIMYLMQDSSKLERWNVFKKSNVSVKKTGTIIRDFAVQKETNELVMLCFKEQNVNISSLRGF